MATIVPILQIGATLIVPIQGELSDRLLKEVQMEVLERIETTRSKGLILDISALEIVDSYTARLLNDLATMARLMGTRSVVVGLSPAIAIILKDLGLRLPSISTARNLERGLELLRAPPDEAAEGPEPH